MIIIKTQNDIEKIKHSLKEVMVKSLEFDMEIINKYFDELSEEEKPMIILIDEDEIDLMKERFKVLKNLENEDEEIIYKDKDEEIIRTVYIITDSGFIVYIRKGQKNV